MEAGLNGMRVSMNSAREDIYTKYYQPNNYTFADVIESLRVVRWHNGWSSINYFTFPGMTDTVEDYHALRHLMMETGLNMIQWRNFNIDPDWYLGKLGITDTGEPLGILQVMQLIHTEFPEVKFGYYNPSVERMNNFGVDFAH